jgi:Putative transposase of IS4/5 family (DUF4096)
MVSWWLGMIWRTVRLLSEQTPPMPRRHEPARPPRRATTQIRQVYEPDLPDAQWEIPRPSLPPPPGGGRPPENDRREVVNGILYVLRTGCAWGLRPRDFPPAGDHR